MRATTVREGAGDRLLGGNFYKNAGASVRIDTCCGLSKTGPECTRRHCHQERAITFQQWDLRHDSFPGAFDLVIVTDLLTLIRRPKRLRMTLEKLVDSLRLGDLMLAGDYHEGKVLEDSWFGRRFLRGGKWIIGTLTAHPSLAVVARASTETHLFALLRKGPPAES